MLDYLKNSLRNSMSRPMLQPVWGQLLKLCHAGMNCGGGQSVECSGEIGALTFALSRVRQTPNKAVTLFDVGGHDGEYLRAVLPLLGDNANVFSFEPQASSFAGLQQSFASDNRVKLRNVALGKESGTAQLFSAVVGESTASLHRTHDSNQVHSEAVQITTLDDVCEAEGIQRIDFLKIDTEGHEMDVLSGASRMLKLGAIEAIQFEFGETFLGTGYNFRDVFELLSPGYSIYRILRSGLWPVNRYVHDVEVYKLTNYLCLKR